VVVGTDRIKTITARCCHLAKLMASPPSHFADLIYSEMFDDGLPFPGNDANKHGKLTTQTS